MAYQQAYRGTHKAEIVAYNKLYEAAHPEFAERHRQQQLAYVQNNREHYTELNRVWRDANREHVRAISSKYNHTDKGHQNSIAKSQTRRARGGQLTRAMVQAIYDANIRKYGQLTCVYCGAVLDLKVPRSAHIDHKVPLARGGKTVKRNLTVACADCNVHKGAA